MAVENYTNLAQSTLASGISSGATSLTVATGGGANFPTTNFRAWISDGVNTEFIFVGSRSSDTFSSITRNYESVSGAPFAFSTGASVLHGPTAGLLPALFQRFISSGTYSARPSAGSAGGENGAIFRATDSFYVSQSDGSAWHPYGPTFQFTEPVLGNFTWQNQGSSTTSTTNGGIFMTTPGGTAGYRTLLKSAPSTPYTITIYALPLLFNNGSWGMVFRESSSGKLHSWVQYSNSGGSGLGAFKFTNDTTFSATYFADAVYKYPVGGVFHWMRLADNGTNRVCSVSADGINWLDLHTVGRTDFLTANQVGFCVNNEGGGTAAAITLLHYKEA